MKEWNKPQLLSLGVENTFEEAGTYAPKNIHYCHDKDANGNDIGWHTNQECHNESRENGCEGTTLCNWQGESHKSKCCGTIAVS